MAMKKQGFFILDAALASALLVGAVVGSSTVNTALQGKEDVEVFGQQVNELLRGLDNRILIGSQYTFPLDIEALDEHQFYSVIRANLIAGGHSDCGYDSVWFPDNDKYQDVALISCDLFHFLESPLGLDARQIWAEYDEAGGLIAWHMQFGYSSIYAWNSASVELASIPSYLAWTQYKYVSGDAIYSLGSLGEQGSVTVRECEGLGERCALNVSYHLHQPSENAEGYVSLAGATLTGDVKFQGSSGLVECYGEDGPQSCGLTLVDDTLMANVSSVSTHAVRLANSAGQCYSPSLGGYTSCGFMLNEAGSHLYALGNTVIVDNDFVVTRNGEDVLTARAGSDTVEFHQSIEVDGMIYPPHWALFNIGGDLRIEDADILPSYMVQSDVLTRIAGDLGDQFRWGWDSRANAPKPEVGQSCEAGTIGLTEDLELLECKNGALALSGDEGIPSGAVMAFGTNSCPSGWSVLSSSRTGFRVAGLAGGSGAGSYVNRNLSHSLTNAHLPSHRHGYTMNDTTRTQHRSNSTIKRGMGTPYDTHTTPTTGTGRAVHMIPRTYAVEFCVKN